MGFLSYENKKFSGGALEVKSIKSVYYGAELLWPHIPVILKVDTSVSKILTIQNVNGYTINWGDGSWEKIKTNNATHTYSEAGVYDVYIYDMLFFPLNFINAQKNVIAVEIIPAGTKITSLGLNAFKDASGIVTFNADLSQIQLTSIPVSSFQNCFAMNSTAALKFISPVFTLVGENAFNSSGINKIAIAGSNNGFSIQKSAFQNCKNLVDVILSKVLDIGASAFQDCSAITVFKAEDLSALTVINTGAFGNAFAATKLDGSNTDITLNISNPNFTLVGLNAFIGSKVRRVLFNLNAKFDIQNGAFQSCNNLYEIALGKVKSIGANAFNGCSSIAVFYAEDLSEITTIGDGAFNGAFAATKIDEITGATVNTHIEFVFTSPNFTYIGLNGFRGSNIWKFKVNPDINFSTGTNAFTDCKNLVEVQVGNVVEFGSAVFQNCSAITVFNDNDLPNLMYIRDGAFINAFAPGSNIEFKITNSNFANVQLNSFAGSKIWKFSVPNDCKFSMHNNGCFMSCTELVEMRLGEVQSIAVNSLTGCTALQDIWIYNPTPPTLNSSITKWGTGNMYPRIHVPQASVAAYQAAAGWSAYAANIQGF